MSGMTMTIYFCGTRPVVDSPTNSPDLGVQGRGIVREGNEPDMFGFPNIPEWVIFPFSLFIDTTMLMPRFHLVSLYVFGQRGKTFLASH